MHGEGGVHMLIFNKESSYNYPCSPTDTFCGTKPKTNGFSRDMFAQSSSGVERNTPAESMLKSDTKKNPWGAFKSKENFLDMHLA